MWLWAPGLSPAHSSLPASPGCGRCDPLHPRQASLQPQVQALLGSCHGLHPGAPPPAQAGLWGGSHPIPPRTAGSAGASGTPPLGLGPLQFPVSSLHLFRFSGRAPADSELCTSLVVSSRKQRCACPAAGREDVGKEQSEVFVPVVRRLRSNEVTMIIRMCGLSPLWGTKG